MATTILEMPETPVEEPTPAEPEKKVVAATTDEPVKSPEKADLSDEPAKEDSPAKAAPPEPEFEVDGEKLTASQIRELREKYERDSKWIQKNEARAAELNREAEELRQLRALKPYIDQRPEVIQELIAARPARNFDAEIQQLYSQRPDPYADPNSFYQWEMAKDRLTTERTAAILEQKSKADYEQRASREYYAEIEKQGQDKYVKAGLVSPDEFQQMSQWIVSNVRTDGRRLPKEVYDVAFKTLYEDKFLASVKLDATRRAIAPLKNERVPDRANPTKVPDLQRTEEDEEDDKFAKAVRGRAGSRYKKLAQD